MNKRIITIGHSLFYSETGEKGKKSLARIWNQQVLSYRYGMVSALRMPGTYRYVMEQSLDLHQTAAQLQWAWRRKRVLKHLGIFSAS